MNTAALLQEALALHDRGAIAEAADRYGRVLEADPNNVEALFRLGRANCQQGRLEAGIELFRRALKIDAHHARSHNLLGLALLRLGRPAEALDSFDRASAADPGYADPPANKGDALSALGRNLEAIREYDRSLAIDPNNVLTLTNHGVALHQGGRTSEALTSFDRALAIDPDFPEAHENRARALSALGRYADALAGFDRAIAARPDAASAYWDRGFALLQLNQVREAFASLDRAITLNPGFAEKLPLVGQSLLNGGKASVALAVSLRALQIGETEAARTLFAESAIATEAYPVDAEFRARIVQALETPWVRPADMARIAADLVKMDDKTGGAVRRADKAWPARLSSNELFGDTGLGEIAGDPVLNALLRATPIHEIALERFLTNARGVALRLAVADETVNNEVLAFFSALAQQCFVNEYVYDVGEDERAEVERLRQALAAATAGNTQVSPLSLAAAAAYGPLLSLPKAETLLQRSWPDAVTRLLDMQIREPLAEQALRKAMPKLTPVEDATSVTVQNLYEESPYPRWVKTPAQVTPIPVDVYLRSKFPASGLRPLAAVDSADILVAGCGTGREPIEYAQALAGTRMLALDLSAASLAYAQNKARTLGLNNIEFAQADILRLGSVGRSFDVILASGVLHHFADPASAWSILLSLLRPRGVMQASFYSADSRRAVEGARAFAAERGYQPTADDIRRCRQEIMALPDKAPAKAATIMPDFFTLSECRYVLFQPPETHMTLAAISRFLSKSRVELIGIEVSADARARYVERFPADTAMTDLNNWLNLERDRPGIFGAAYNFWIQKP